MSKHPAEETLSLMDKVEKQEKWLESLLSWKEEAEKHMIEYGELVSRHADLIEEIKSLRSQIAQMQDLITESYGVANLHLNGDVAPWDELLPGGRFEEWLSEWEVRE